MLVGALVFTGAIALLGSLAALVLGFMGWHDIGPGADRATLSRSLFGLGLFGFIVFAVGLLGAWAA
jgi:hypothetical protein